MSWPGSFMIFFFLLGFLKGEAVHDIVHASFNVMLHLLAHQIGIAGLDVFQDIPVFPDREKLMVLG